MSVRSVPNAVIDKRSDTIDFLPGQPGGAPAIRFLGTDKGFYLNEAGQIVAVGAILSPTFSGGMSYAPPVYNDQTSVIVSATDHDFILAGLSPVTVTLPSAAANPGRELCFVSWSQAISSASPNVWPLNGSGLGTAIIAGDGGWARLVSNGTDWIKMAGAG